MIILYLLYGNRYLIRFLLVILLLISTTSCIDCIKVFPFNETNMKEPIYLLNTQKYIQKPKPVICSCIDIPCTNTICHQEIYEVTNYEIGTSDGTIIFTTPKSEKLKDEWRK